jgi:hypothetical protein
MLGTWRDRKPLLLFSIPRPSIGENNPHHVRLLSSASDKLKQPLTRFELNQNQ